MKKSKISTICDAGKLKIHCKQIHFIKVFKENSPNMNRNEENHSLLPSGNNNRQNKTKNK